jgi:hypothetical protein
VPIAKQQRSRTKLIHFCTRSVPSASENTVGVAARLSEAKYNIFIYYIIMSTDFIPTKKKRVRYQFINTQQQEEKPDSSIHFYYQICTFPNRQTQKYHMRKFVINSKNEFVAVNDYYLSTEQCRKFFSMKKPQEYKCYSVYSLDDIAYPNLAELLVSKSDILTNDYNYTGFAPFT